jgi:CBS domain-containing protein
MGISEFDEAWEDDPDHMGEQERRVGEALLHVPIRALEPHEAVTVPASASIGESIRIMLDRGIGALLVTAPGGGIAGIFTERDVMRRVAAPGVAHSRPVSDVMTPDPETLAPDDGVAFALNRMVIQGYRHVPIVDGDEPLGILSVRDVVRYIVSLMPARVLNLPPEPSLEARSPEGG